MEEVVCFFQRQIVWPDAVCNGAALFEAEIKFGVLLAIGGYMDSKALVRFRASFLRDDCRCPMIIVE